MHSRLPYEPLIFPNDQSPFASVLDQRLLPHQVQYLQLSTWQEAAEAIRNMTVRGAPLIGLTGAVGLALAATGLGEQASPATLKPIADQIESTRPTAVNLHWALVHMLAVAEGANGFDLGNKLWAAAAELADDDRAACYAIGTTGLAVIQEIAAAKKGPVRILTHCNAGRLATMDWGTATAPIYLAHQAGIDIQVWVDETRPRLQGLLTAFELNAAGVPTKLITDNAGGHLMQTKQVDMVIVGADRCAANGDIANKIGTYLKALAAQDNGIPFYVAFPCSTLDMDSPNGASIEIEERSADEVLAISGMVNGQPGWVSLAADQPVANPGFDITPAALITGFMTEHGLVAPQGEALGRLYQTAQNKNEWKPKVS